MYTNTREIDATALPLWNLETGVFAPGHPEERLCAKLAVLFFLEWARRVALRTVVNLLLSRGVIGDAVPRAPAPTHLAQNIRTHFFEMALRHSSHRGCRVASGLQACLRAKYPLWRPVHVKGLTKMAEASNAGLKSGGTRGDSR